jgi:dimethylaniline monooxygenase (N-oxide forming)
VRVFCGDILSVESHLLRLTTGDAIRSDAILCGTGWVPSLQFFSQDLRRELGLPHFLSEESEDENLHWNQLDTAADQKVLASFPQLAHPPLYYQKSTLSTPYRLYKLIAPISKSDDTTADRSLFSLAILELEITSVLSNVRQCGQQLTWIES